MADDSVGDDVRAVPTFEFYRALAEPAASIVVVVAADMRIRWASPSVAWIGGYDPDELIGVDARTLVHPDDVEMAIAGVTEAATRDDKGIPVLGRPFPFRLLGRHGTLACEIGGDIRFDDPAVEGMVLRIRVAPTHSLLDRFLEGSVSQAPLQETVAPLLELLEFEAPGSSAMLAYDGDGDRFLGIVTTRTSPEIGRLASTITALPQDGPGITTARGSLPWSRAVRDRAFVCMNIDELPHAMASAMADGGFRACWAQPVAIAGGAITACLVVWRQIEGEPWVGHDVAVERTARLAALAVERFDYEQQLVHAASHDPLTGLLNRRAFYEQLERCNGGTPMAVLFIDLDGFKPVNDELGHDAGDTVLCAIADRLRHTVRAIDTPARLGGDEFAILLAPPCSADDATAIAERVVAATTTPIPIGGGAVSVGVSIGVAVASSDRVGDPTDLLDVADGAMYRAKQAGGRRWQLA